MSAAWVVIVALIALSAGASLGVVVAALLMARRLPEPAVERLDLGEQLQLDLTSTILRIRQAWHERDTAGGELLLTRLAERDAPRLERYLDERWLGELDAAGVAPARQP